MKKNQLLLFFQTPFFFGNIVLEVIVVAFPALFAISVLYSVLLLHNLSDLTPFDDFVNFNKLF